MIEIGEEVVKKRVEYNVEDTSNVYNEIRDLLNSRVSFGTVKEEKYYNDIETGVVRAEIETMDQYDKYFFEEIEILLTIKPESVKIELEGELVAKYPNSGWRDNLVYYGYIALFHRLIGIKNQHKYEEWVEGKVEELTERIDNSL